MVLCYIPGKSIIQSSYHRFYFLFQNTKQGKMNRRKNKFVNTVCATTNGKKEEQNNKIKYIKMKDLKYMMHQ